MSWYSVEENLVKPAEVDATSDPGYVLVPHTDDEIKGMTPIYLRRVLMGHMLLADVPERWREEVRELLADDAWAVPAVEQ